MGKQAITWKFDDLVFDGTGGNLIMSENPLAEAPTFTIEAHFIPEAGGEKEQRFLHIQGDDESRALLELRATTEGWYADVFLHFESGERFLNNPEFIHPLGRPATMAMVYTGSEIRQYVNGQMELSGSIPAGVLGQGQTSLGMRMNGISPFKGRILEVRFTPSILSEKDLLRPPS